MSRIGKKPIELPEKVKVDISPSRVKVTGPKGSLETDYKDIVEITQDGNHVLVKTRRDNKRDSSFQGLYQRLIRNMVIGVTEGFSRELEIVGLGYRANMEGKNLVLNVGFSHPVNITPSEGITFEVPEAGKIVVKGIDKHLVGQTAADIRALRPPEPYKGKGVRYKSEYVRRKVGKTGG